MNSDTQLTFPDKSEHNCSSSLVCAIILMTYKPRKLGQTDLDFGLRSELISRCMHYKWLCSSYDLCQPG